MIGCLKLRRSIPSGRSLNTKPKAWPKRYVGRTCSMKSTSNRARTLSLELKLGFAELEEVYQNPSGDRDDLAVPVHRTICSHCVFNDAFPAAGRKTVEPELRQRGSASTGSQDRKRRH